MRSVTSQIWSRSVSLLTAAGCCLAMAGAAHGADFRNAAWGMTLNEVIALHPQQLPADRRLNRIAFDGKLAGLDVLIYYRFDETGALAGAGYEIATQGRDDLAVIDDYQLLNTLLQQKYQDSQAPRLSWRNRIFEPKPDEWGRAVRIGHLTYDWSYSAERTDISHSLSGNRRSIQHVLRYEARGEQSSKDVLEDL